jgi:flagellar biosynthesis GTPase FlhF
MNNLRSIDLFSEEPNVLFFGYPGSGTAVTMAKIAAKFLQLHNQKWDFVSCDLFHADIGHKIKMLASHLELDYQEKTLADLEQLTGKNHFIYLECPAIATIAEYQAVFHNPAFKKALVLDCTRKDDVNTALIRLIGKDIIDGIIPTKIDLVQDKKAVYEYLCLLELPIAFLSYGEKIIRDGNFPSEEKNEELLCQ